MKRFLSICLAVCLMVSMLPLQGDAASANNFKDVQEGIWYYPAVDYVASNGLINGVSSDRFDPESSMTRGMFVTVIGRMAKVETASYTGSDYSDVSQNAYYAPYINWASRYGIVNGVDQRHFAPDVEITREQMTKILYIYAQKTGNNTSFGNNALVNFRDNANISDYALSPMKWAVDKGIIKGVSANTIAPQRFTTRAEVAQVLMNARDVLVHHTIDEAPAPTPDPGESIEYNRAAAQEVFRLVNEARRNVGLQELSWGYDYEAGADIRAKELTEKFSHTRPDGTEWHTVGNVYGENIQWASYKMTAQQVFENWMDSPGHRANIMSADFRSIAISGYENADGAYWVQLFGI